ncbi:MAG: helix-turn-helix transcriptional regulator, partial [Bacillota bacterium]|nr:helix-turn-helix transcriptional regulator [Bacillota bacterium]
VDYKPLWHLLLDRNMMRTELRKRAGISTRQLAKMGKNQDVSTDVLRKICTVLNCTFDDIVEIKPDEQDATNDNLK